MMRGVTERLEFDGYDAADFERRMLDFEQALEQVEDLFERVRELEAHELGIDPMAVRWYSYDDQRELVEDLKAWREFLEMRGFISRGA